MRRLFCISLLLSCLSLLGWAERIDQQVAQRVARTVANSFAPSALRASDQPISLVYAAAAAQEGASLRSSTDPAAVDYYVFNVGSQQGFVIVAGEDRVHPVLGYAEKGSFDPDHIPTNLRGMLAQYQKEIDYAVGQDLEASETIRSEWNRLESGIALRSSSEVVLLQTAKWDQYSPYNNHTPMLGSDHTATGCIATATGILLQYAQYPTQLVKGVSSYADTPISYGTYDWSLMPLSCPTTDAEIEQVSTLLWHIGANVQMNYGLDLSTTYDVNAALFLRNNAQFNKGTRLIYKNDHYWKEWKDMIRQTLRGSDGQGYPLLYRGEGSGGGHMFILDGFGPDEYFHVNWGWDGYYDGNYLLTALDVFVRLNDEMAMVYDAVPKTVADADFVELRYDEFDLEGNITAGESFTIQMNWVNAGSVTHEYCVGIGLFDKDGNFKKAIHQTTIKKNLPNAWWTKDKLTCQIDGPLDETDQIAPMYKVNESDSKWIRMRNAPTAPLYISGNGESVSNKDVQSDPTVSISTGLSGLSISPEVESITYGGKYKATLSVVDPGNYKLPESITVRQVDTDEPWVDYTYDAGSGKLVINKVTMDVRIEAAAVPLQGFSVTLQLEGLNAIGVESGSKIKEGDFLNLRFGTISGEAHLPRCIQVWEDGEALSSDGYTYNPDAGSANDDYHFSMKVYGNIKIIASAIGQDQLELLLDLDEIKTDLSSTALENGSQIKFRLTANTGYTLPSELTVKMGDVALVAGSDYSYNSTNGDFDLGEITGDLEISGKAEAINYGAAIYNLSHITLGNHTETAKHWDSFQCELKADEGYDLPTTVQVKMNGVQLETDYRYTDGWVIIDVVTGPIEITASARPKAYPVTLSLNNLTSNFTVGNTISHGETLTVQLDAEEGYKLPERVVIWMAGQQLTADAFSYDSTNGVVTVPNVTGGVEISAYGINESITYAVRLELSNLTTVPVVIPAVAHGSSLTIELVAVDPFGLPDVVTVAVGGVTITTGYTYSNGYLTIDAVTGEVLIIAKGQRDEEVASGERTLSGDYTTIKVSADDGPTKLSLDQVNTDQLSMLGGGSGTLEVAGNSTIQQLENQGTLELTGGSDTELTLGTIVNQGTLKLDESLKLASDGVSVVNDGTFYDYTGQIKQVVGSGALAMVETLPKSKHYTLGSSCVLSVKTEVAAPEASQGIVSFEWQRKVDGQWVNIPRLLATIGDSEEIVPGEDVVREYPNSYTVPQGEQGVYRCLVRRAYNGGSSTTLLCTTTTVSYSEPIPTPIPDPDPVPTYIYKVTLPTLEGAWIFTLDKTEVTKGDNFKFKINLMEGYTTENLQVKANGSELLPNASGWYTIASIREDVVVTITGIVKVVPDGVSGVDRDVTFVWTSKGHIHIHQTIEGTVTVTDFTGRVLRRLDGSVGDHTIPMPAGQYIVTVGAETFKVVL